MFTRDSSEGYLSRFSLQSARQLANNQTKLAHQSGFLLLLILPIEVNGEIKAPNAAYMGCSVLSSDRRNLQQNTVGMIFFELSCYFYRLD